MSTVTIETVRRVAELASLDLTVEEEPSMQRDLNAILDHIARLNELDTLGIEPMSQVGSVFGLQADLSGGSLRSDLVRSSLPSRVSPESGGRSGRELL